VDEIVHPGEEYPIKAMGDARVLELRGQLLPVVDLSELLGHPPKESAKHETFVVVLRLDHFAYELIVSMVVDATGRVRALGEEKRYLFEARLGKIISESGARDIPEFIALAKADATGRLRDKIIDSMTTHETYWFRDTRPWEALEKSLLPELAA